MDAPGGRDGSGSEDAEDGWRAGRESPGEDLRDGGALQL